jgi:ATP-binding cassette, subfamily B, bacterial MsbA
MKRFSTILKYLGGYKSNIGLYILFIILSILFSAVSLASLPSFLSLLFDLDKRGNVLSGMAVKSSGLLDTALDYLKLLIQKSGKPAALAFICIAVIVSIFFKNLFLYFSYYVLAPMRNGVMTRLRADLYNKILVLPIGYFTEQKKGDLMSRMSNDANEVEWSVMSTLEAIIKEPLNIIFYLTLMISISPKLSLMLLIFLPLMGFIIGRVSRTLKKQSTAAQEKNGLALSILDETLGGMRVIKAFTAEKLLQGKFLQVNTDLNNIRNKMNFRRDLASPMSEFLGVLALSGVLWIGGSLVLHNSGGLKAEAFILYILAFTQIINPAKALSTAFYNVQRGSSAVKRIEEILQAPMVIEEPANPTTFTHFTKNIELRDVSFSYEDVTILDGINLNIEKGKTIALVGSSGAGKSTLADLVPRFHDVSAGALLIDGVNIKDYSLHALRSQMSIVTQEPILFNDTIANNIALGKTDATKEEIINAARIANAHNFIIQKEEGYDTNIGDRGNKLSGGERQRLTIARAVLKNPPILILDEATSSLDTESERLVQDAINNMMQNRTSIVIAHRLSTIRHADEIIVLQKGKIVERGTHDQLMQAAGFYKKLVDMQEVK